MRSRHGSHQHNSLKTAAAQWLLELEIGNRSPFTLKSYRRYSQPLLKHLGNRLLKDITADDIREYLSVSNDGHMASHW